jgi:hypothetical protein
MLVRKYFFDPFFYVLKKCLRPKKNFQKMEMDHPPPPPPPSITFLMVRP